MSKRPHETLIQYIGELVGLPKQDDLSDHQLLEAFLSRGDQTAFTCLVKRHHRLVYAVCYSKLADQADVEDAFQATFLVLARRARDVAGRDCVRRWLCTTALHVSYKALRQAKRRRKREREAAKPAAVAARCPHQAELSGVLSEEIRRLPVELQKAGMLCWLHGTPQKEAAEQLGMSLRTLERRLGEARELLRSRLAQQGFGLTATLLAAGLSENQANAIASPALVEATVKSALPHAAGESLVGSPRAAMLAEAVVRGMKIAAKLKAVAVVLLLGAVFATGLIIARGPGSIAPQRDLVGVAQPTGVLAAAPSPAKEDIRRKQLNEVVVPRLIAALQQLGGKARVTEAVIRDDQVMVTLAWSDGPLQKAPLAVRVEHTLFGDDFTLFYDDGKGEFRERDPAQPIYWQPFGIGPKIGAGGPQAAEMRAALATLREAPEERDVVSRVKTPQSNELVLLRNGKVVSHSKDDAANDWKTRMRDVQTLVATPGGVALVLLRDTTVRFHSPSNPLDKWGYFTGGVRILAMTRDGTLLILLEKDGKSEYHRPDTDW